MSLVRTVWLMGLALLLGLPVSAQAQRPTGGQKKVEIPEPQDVTLTTKDGVLLTATYFGGTKGKDSVPLILLHGEGEQRTVMAPLGRYIQALGHCALAIDFRGHGGSVRRAAGGPPVMEASRMRPSDFVLLSEDLEAAKRFLLGENDAERCNIDLLGLVAAEEACAPAVVWSVGDWSWPVLPGRRQGRDVKGLVLLSPQRQWGAVSMQAVITSPYLTQMSTLIVVGGTDRSSLAETNNLKKSLESVLKRNRIDPDAAGPGGVRPLAVVEAPTSLAGTELIDPRNRLGVEAVVGDFIRTQLAARSGASPWTKRGS